MLENDFEPHQNIAFQTGRRVVTESTDRLIAAIEKGCRILETPYSASELHKEALALTFFLLTRAGGFCHLFLYNKEYFFKAILSLDDSAILLVKSRFSEYQKLNFAAFQRLGIKLSGDLRQWLEAAVDAAVGAFLTHIRVRDRWFKSPVRATLTEKISRSSIEFVLECSDLFETMLDSHYDGTEE